MKSLLFRLRRIKGQVSGIEKMIEEKRSCLEVIQQISAARSALAKVGGILLAQASCQGEKKKKAKDFEKVIEELVKSL